MVGSLDAVYDAVWTFANGCRIVSSIPFAHHTKSLFAQRVSQDDVCEDIEMQRTMYESDRKADGIGLKRTLKDVLRNGVRDDVLNKLSEKEVAALYNAVKFVSSPFIMIHPSIRAHKSLTLRNARIQIRQICPGYVGTSWRQSNHATLPKMQFQKNAGYRTSLKRLSGLARSLFHGVQRLPYGRESYMETR